MALPHELPAWAERSNVWHTYYEPKSPATAHLVNEGARATLKMDRCASYEQSTIEEQTQAESEKWRTGQKRKANRLAKDVRTQPRSTVEKLQSFGEGTRLMIRCFEELIEDVQSQGYLPQDDLELVLCLFGITPTRENMRQNALAYLISITNLGCTPGVSSAVVAELLKPENRPEELRDSPVDEIFGADADENRDLLVGQLELEVERLQAEATRLEREIDGPRLRAILERASILTEEAARRVTRSHAEARSSYHRATSALWPLLEREKEQGPPEPADDDHNEAREPAIEPVSACRDEASGSQMEPEDPSGAWAQAVDESAGSVEGRPSGPDRQNGVFSPAPAPENRPSEAPVEGRGPEGHGDAPSVVAPPRPWPAWAASVPLSACRRADSLLTEEEEKAKNGSDQVVDSGECPVAGRSPGAGPYAGVSSLAHAVPEQPLLLL